MFDRNRMIEMHLQMLAELGWKPPSGDVIDEIANGGLLTVAQAATICEVTDQTIYRWIEDASSKGQSLRKKTATWLIGTAWLLDYLESYQGGLPARVKADNRLREYWSIWSQSRDLRRVE
ncbi:hypothetical protein SAMN05216338_106339 [Bradyrhizobium sp. Rc2d]|uniref:hypothetical protein n=1 Tax=Bradyrhizobium sp. Rc2d TaxID=1855321 RepID=UPI00088BBE43|nr:hypothetical protein [Bradyrhizobium sp. Rc2d]SDJ74951.1 hypothetical protein SAMN05216338_106339 [Bradyrhizobium sp. Rc2d]